MQVQGYLGLKLQIVNHDEEAEYEKYLTRKQTFSKFSDKLYMTFRRIISSMAIDQFLLYWMELDHFRRSSLFPIFHGVGEPKV